MKSFYRNSQGSYLFALGVRMGRIACRLAVAIFCLCGVCAPSLAVSITKVSNDSVVIPDGDWSGVLRSVTFGDAITSVEDVELTLNVSGGYNGDYFAYLLHDTGFSILLNRPGATASNPLGVAGAGMNASFRMDATADVHLAGPGFITGTFQPDGRESSPLSVTEADDRTAMLNSFAGLNPSGVWSLFIADLSGGGIGTLDSWSLTVTGPASGLPEAVPDSAGTSILLLVSVGGLALFRAQSVRA